MIAGYSSLSDGRPCAVGLAPLACLPGSVGRFTAVEHAQLHLDVVGGHWERETLLLGLVSSASTNGGELDDDPLVTLDKRVDDELVGTRLKFEMLEGVDVQADRQRRKESRDLWSVDDDALDPTGSVGYHRATAE